jgi:uncharacterized protein YbjT (DUF2867 family)
MADILILGANGQLARNTTRAFLRDTDAQLTLHLRRASRLTNPEPSRVTIADGNVLDAQALQAAMKGQDVVYANLAGDMKAQAEHIVEALGSFHAHPALRRKWSACTPDLNRCVDRSSRCRALDRP